MLRSSIACGRALWLLAVAIVLGMNAAGSAAAKCRSPRFQLARDFVNYESGRGSAHISLTPADFTLPNLVCLAQVLKAQHPDWKQVNVLMFSSQTAATGFSPGKLGPEELWQFDRQLRAFYSVDVDAREEFLAITPMGLEGGDDYDTRLHLPPSGTPHCRLEVNDRCLLAVEPLKYQVRELREAAPGSVTLAATIGRDGRLAGITLV